MNQQTFDEQYHRFWLQSQPDGRFQNIDDSHPILDDDKPKHDEKDFSLDYWLHCSYVAREMALHCPQTHVDFGSYLYFAGIVSAFVDHFIYCDIRSVPSVFSNLEWRREDLMTISFNSDSLRSVSCLHTIEHCGLGRYGDKIDASGDLKAASELSRILAPGGHLYIVAPMDENPRVTFNSDRYYSLALLRQMFHALKMEEFSFIFGGKLWEDSQDVPKNSVYTGIATFTK